MGIFKLLEKYRRNTSVKKSVEYDFYEANEEVISRYPYVLKWGEISDDFELIKATIITQALTNKIKLERNLMFPDGNLSYNINETAESLPFITFGNSKVYIPLFPLAVNIIYLKTPEKLLTNPYSLLVSNFKDSMINPFDTYGYALYESNFTNLVTISEDETSRAFYHPNFKVVYIINNQGSLDVKLCLFDKFMKNPNEENLLKRIKTVLDYYYNFDKNGFIKALYENRLISEKLYRIYQRSN